MLLRLIFPVLSGVKVYGWDMKRRQIVKLAAIAAISFGLTACSGSEQQGVELHRDQKRNISSTTRFDAERFSGRWVIRGEFAHPENAPTYGAVSFRQSGGKINSIDVSSGSSSAEHYAVTQPELGRIVVGNAPFETQYWVLWVDADYRTAAIGTPSGSFGWIIDRSRAGGEDRIKAARDVLGANGYNLSRLKTR